MAIPMHQHRGRVSFKRVAVHFINRCLTKCYRVFLPRIMRNPLGRYRQVYLSLVLFAVFNIAFWAGFLSSRWSYKHAIDNLENKDTLLGSRHEDLQVLRKEWELNRRRELDNPKFYKKKRKLSSARRNQTRNSGGQRDGQHSNNVEPSKFTHKLKVIHTQEEEEGQQYASRGIDKKKKEKQKFSHTDDNKEEIKALATIYPTNSLGPRSRNKDNENERFEEDEAEDQEDQNENENMEKSVIKDVHDNSQSDENEEKENDSLEEDDAEDEEDQNDEEIPPLKSVRQNDTTVTSQQQMPHETEQGPKNERLSDAKKENENEIQRSNKLDRSPPETVQDSTQHQQSHRRSKNEGNIDRSSRQRQDKNGNSNKDNEEGKREIQAHEKDQQERNPKDGKEEDNGNNHRQESDSKESKSREDATEESEDDGNDVHHQNQQEDQQEQQVHQQQELRRQQQQQQQRIQERQQEIQQRRQEQQQNEDRKSRNNHAEKSVRKPDPSEGRERVEKAQREQQANEEQNRQRSERQETAEEEEERRQVNEEQREEEHQSRNPNERREIVKEVEKRQPTNEEQRNRKSSERQVAAEEEEERQQGNEEQQGEEQQSQNQSERQVKSGKEEAGQQQVEEVKRKPSEGQRTAEDEETRQQIKEREDQSRKQNEPEEAGEEEETQQVKERERQNKKKGEQDKAKEEEAREQVREEQRNRKTREMQKREEDGDQSKRIKQEQQKRKANEREETAKEEEEREQVNKEQHHIKPSERQETDKEELEKRQVKEEVQNRKQREREETVEKEEERQPANSKEERDRKEREREETTDKEEERQPANSEEEQNRKQRKRQAARETADEEEERQRVKDEEENKRERERQEKGIKKETRKQAAEEKQQRTPKEDENKQEEEEVKQLNNKPEALDKQQSAANQNAERYPTGHEQSRNHGVSYETSKRQDEEVQKQETDQENDSHPHIPEATKKTGVLKQLPLINMDDLEDKRPQVLIVIFVLSSPLRYERRQAIRETWWPKCKEPQAACLFVTDGYIDESLNDGLLKEKEKYNDMLFLPVDEGLNFGMRLLFLMEWVQTKYRPEFFLRMDDDYFLCIERLLNELPQRPKENLVWGFWHCDRRTATFIDESFMLLSYDLIERFLSWDENKLLCHPFGDQQLGIWLNSVPSIRGFSDFRLHHHPPASKHHALRNLSNICDRFLGLHGTYPEDMRRFWLRGNDGKKAVSGFVRIYPTTCRYRPHFEWQDMDPKFRHKPELCIKNPRWTMKREMWVGRQSELSK